MKTNPNRIKSVEERDMPLGDAFNEWIIKTHGGAEFLFQKLHRNIEPPKVGQEIDEWIFHLTPLNDEAYEVEIK